MIAYFNNYLDRTPMYRVVLWSLVGIWILALWGSVIGQIGFGWWEILVSTFVILTTALLVSYVCGLITGVAAQHESSLITGLILVFLLMPSTTVLDLFSMVAVTMLAISSKYVLVINRQHVVNPVVAGLVIGSFFGYASGAWWVASSFLFLPILLLGSLVVVKVRKVPMVLTFILVSFVTYASQSSLSEALTFESITRFLWSYPTLFLGFFMLTEPFTTPPQKHLQYLYAAMVGFLANTAWLSSVLVMTPELALLLANVVFFATTLRQKLQLSLLSIREVSPKIFEFSFKKPTAMQFAEGQYMEWMLPHKASDSRGVRRYFTITSSALESTIRLTFKLPEQASSFKKAMVNLSIGDKVIASQRAGDFVLPKVTTQKIGWIAGGIGVTPFVSQANYLSMAKEQRDIAMLYAVSSRDDLAYQADLEAVAKTVYVLSKGEAGPNTETGFINEAIINKHFPDYLERVWYISGPPPMVKAVTTVLRSMKVPKRKIKRDFFPGLA